MANVPYNNDDIIQWRDKNYNAIVTEIAALGIQHRPNSPSPKALAKSITKKHKIKNGLIVSVSYGMPRSGIFRHKGVGRGRGINSGKTNPARWFSNPTNRNFPELEEIVAANDATYVINNLTIK
jgi:hypothetical protein